MVVESVVEDISCMPKGDLKVMMLMMMTMMKMTMMHVKSVSGCAIYVFVVHFLESFINSN